MSDCSNLNGRNKRKAAEMQTLCVSVGVHPTGMHSYLKLKCKGLYCKIYQVKLKIPCLNL